MPNILAGSCRQTQIGVCERHNNMLANDWGKVGENRDKLIQRSIFKLIQRSMTM